MRASVLLSLYRTPSSSITGLYDDASRTRRRHSSDTPTVVDTATRVVARGGGRLYYPSMKLPHHTIHKLEEGLNEAFEDFPEVEAVFLFGSVAEGRAGAESDLDLAIVPSGAGLRERRLDLLSALVRAGLDDVDLVFLDTADVVLRYEAVRPNFLIYARESFDHGEYYSRTLREYWDFLPYLELQRESMKRRILYGQT